jgi:transcription termination factor Rho
VEQQIAGNNVNAGGSFLEAGLQQINVREVGLVRNVHDIENTVLTTKSGTPLRVKDIAVVSQGPKIRLGQFARASRREDGKVFLVAHTNGFHASSQDPVLDAALVARWHLESGLRVAATGHASNGQQRPLVADIATVEGMPIEEYRQRAVPFSELVSIDPTERFHLETDAAVLEPRVIELLAPIGKGQRCLIVSPPKAGKTTLLQQLAHAIAVNHPETTIFVLLVDERPEEVTD